MRRSPSHHGRPWRASAPNYRWTVAQLLPLKPRAYLEIGFGTGRLAQMIAKTLQPTRLVGFDPPELMLETARGKLMPFASALSLELKCGDDTMQSSIDGPFDAVVAVHSFQFWQYPAATPARIHELLSHSGALVLVVRRRDSNHTAFWIPNPISKKQRRARKRSRSACRSGLPHRDGRTIENRLTWDSGCQSVSSTLRLRLE